MVFSASPAQRRTEGARATKTGKMLTHVQINGLIVGTVSAPLHQNVAVTGRNNRFYGELKWRG